MSEPTIPTTDRHSPGPWRAARVPINPWWKVYIEGHDVAEVEGGDIIVYNDPNHPDAVEANARLIAAAPELLAALKAVVALSDRKHDAWDAAWAAIDKAEGRANV